VPKLVADAEQVDSGFQQVGGKAVPEGMCGDFFCIPEAAFAC